MKLSAKEEDKFPSPGTELFYNEEGNWVGENGVKMLIENVISECERQEGQAVCRFIALAHAELVMNNGKIKNDPE